MLPGMQRICRKLFQSQEQGHQKKVKSPEERNIPHSIELRSQHHALSLTFTVSYWPGTFQESCPILDKWEYSPCQITAENLTPLRMQCLKRKKSCVHYWKCRKAAALGVTTWNFIPQDRACRVR